MKTLWYWVGILGFVVLAEACRGQNAHIRPSASIPPATREQHLQHLVEEMRDGIDLPPAVISGTVYDSSNAPAPGVLLVLYPGKYPGSPKEAEARTDTNGRYLMTVQFNKAPFELIHEWVSRNCMIARDLKRNMAVIAEISNLPKSMNFKLQHALKLTGRVTGTDGAPLKGVPMAVMVQANEQLFTLTPHPDSTDADGMFSMPALPEGLEYFCFNENTAPGYGADCATLKSEQTHTDHISLPVFVLKQANRKVAGTVYDADGKPLKGIKVQFTGAGQPRLHMERLESEDLGTYTCTVINPPQPGEVPEAVTDEKGRFSFNSVCDGPLLIFAYGPRGTVAHAQGGDTNVAVRFASNLLVLKDSQLVTTSGRVLDPSGTPVPGALLLPAPCGRGWPVYTDARGNYTVTWVSQYTPAFWNGPITMFAEDLKRHLAVGQMLSLTSTNIDLHLKEMLTLSIKVQDKKSQPIPTAYSPFLYLFADHFGWYWSFDPFSARDLRRNANKDGLIKIMDLPQGQEYQIQIDAPGYEGATLKVQAPETNTTHYDVPPVTLEAVDPKGP
jgi:protocatechuate 3,4-dioxygenase beta subunit